MSEGEDRLSAVILVRIDYPAGLEAGGNSLTLFIEAIEKGMEGAIVTGLVKDPRHDHSPIELTCYID